MAVVTHTFISKCNTIMDGCPYNTGLNPVIELNYGKTITRALVYFDVSRIQELVNDKTYPDMEKLRHVLKMTNAGSLSPEKADRPLLSHEGMFNKRRASSFDLIFFLVPDHDWDEGRGFDYAREAHGEHVTSLSTQGSSWFQYKTYYKWDTDGIYTSDRLSKEFDKFTSGGISDIIIGYQHFDFGNENIDLDITNTVNKFVSGDLENHGICMSFAPSYEFSTDNKMNYVGFYSNHTQGFFEPYVETTYDDHIQDDRLCFHLDSDNKLYFYSIMGNEYVNLDELPTCSVNGSQMDVRQATKGVYYAEVNLGSDEYEADRMLYDTWSNISYDGRMLDDVELEFVTLPPKGTFGLPVRRNEMLRPVPSLYGIGNSERIKRGDIRKINVELMIPYTSGQIVEAVKVEYRLYVKSADRQVDVISWQQVEQEFNNAYFIINTDELVPSRYFIDMRVTYDSELIYHYGILRFDIVRELDDAIF